MSGRLLYQRQPAVAIASVLKAHTPPNCQCRRDDAKHSCAELSVSCRAKCRHQSRRSIVNWACPGSASRIQRQLASSGGGGARQRALDGAGAFTQQDAADTTIPVMTTSTVTHCSLSGSSSALPSSLALDAVGRLVIDRQSGGTIDPG